MRKNLLQALACASALGAASQALAQEEAQTNAAGGQLERDLELSKKLNEIQLFDYSELYLRKRIDANQGDADPLRVQLADTLIQWNKLDDAQKIAAQIPQNSIYAAKAYAAIGIAAANRGNFDQAIKSLEQVLAIAQKDAKIMDELNDKLQYLRVCYEKTGKLDKVKNLIDALSVGQDPRESAYVKILSVLDTAQNMFDEEEGNPEKAKAFKAARDKRLAIFNRREELKRKKSAEVDALKNIDLKDWQSIAIYAVNELEELQWGGQDVISAFSYPMNARALLMLGRVDAAISELDRAPQELMNACDEPFKQKKNLGQAPNAYARYWQGEAYYRKAQAAATTDEKVDLLKKSFKSFGKLLRDYQGFADGTKAYSRFTKVCDDLIAADPGIAARINATRNEIPVPQGGNAVEDEEIVPPAVEVAFKDKRYEDVVKGLLPVVRERRMSSGAPDGFYKLAIAMASTKRDLEAMALCNYMAACFPKAQHTVVALLQVGEIFWKANTPVSKADAISLYEIFLKVAPDHQYACDMAMRVAQDYYNKALATAMEANKLPAGDLKRVKSNEAVEAFKKAIPHYQRIIAKFGNRKDWVDKSYYYLALSFSSSKQYNEAANTYLAFCESTPDDMTQIGDAKLRAADALFQAGQDYEKRAREMREEAIAMGDAPAAAQATTPAPAKEQEPAKDSTESKETTAPVEAAEAQKEAAPASSREGKLAQAAKFDAQAVDAYKEGVGHAKEFLNEWVKEGGRLASVAGSPKVKKCVEDSMQLLPWLYDANNQKKDAVANFKIFIDKYPKNKNVPACMMRMGVIYTELDDSNSAEKILGDLSTRFYDSPEGRNAKFYLARSLYNNEKYDKAVEIIGEILHTKALLDNLSVSSLRWIATNLWNCGGKRPAPAAKLSLEAAELLLAKLNKPDLKEWVGQQKAVELAANPKERESSLGFLRQRMLCDAGLAAYWSELYTKSIDYYTQVLKDDKTPCFFDAKFGRADAYQKLKDFDSARTDLTDASLRANTGGKFALYDKAQCLVGDLCIDTKDFSRAFAAFNIVAIMDTDNSANAQIAAYVKKTEAEKLEAEKDAKAAAEWIEYAIYKTAFCAAKLGKDADKAKMVEKYKKSFPAGRFIADLAKLPAPEGANKP